MNIKQIAKAAGVSVATVSRVINHPDNVAPATREKIQKVMEEFEYKPNWFAQGLNFNTTKTIGIVVPHIRNSVYMEIAQGVQDVALQKDYITFIGNGEMNPNNEKEFLDHFEKRRVDGVIVMFSSLDQGELKKLQEKGTPVVLIGVNKEVTGFNMVEVDGTIAASNMVKHLLSCGHRKIEFLYGADPKLENDHMIEGYKKALIESGQNVEDLEPIQVKNSIEGGYLGAKKLLDRKLPDAIYASNDNIAYGVIDALKDAGIKVPEDVAVVGFGNYRMSNMVEPKLTTTSVEFHKMGVYGARLLFDMIEGGGGDSSKTTTITLQTKIKVRKSCGHKERIGEMF